LLTCLGCWLICCITTERKQHLDLLIVKVRHLESFCILHVLDVYFDDLETILLDMFEVECGLED